MPSIRRALKNLLFNRAQFVDSVISNCCTFLPDKLYLSLRYRCKMGQWINWNTPKTFAEKLQWLKVYNRRPEYTMMVDKYAVKDYVANIIGDKYIIPTIGVWDTPEDISWDSLPNQFVLKTTQGGGGGGVVICRDKATLDKEEAIKILKESLRLDLYSSLREWPYKNVQRRVLAEMYIEPSQSVGSGDLPDYKFFCFNGIPLYCQVIRDRSGMETIDFYDMNWKHLPFVGLNPVRPTKDTPIARNGTTPVPRPNHLDAMKEICEKLSKGIPFVRVDLYVVGEVEFFGELTFFPASGMGTFTPEEWQYKLGEMIKLPIEDRGKFCV